MAEKYKDKPRKKIEPVDETENMSDKMKKIDKLHK